MHLHLVSPRTGLQWFTHGIRLFWRQPLALSGLFFLFMAMVSLTALVPMVGGVLGLLLMPALSLGMMAAADVAGKGQFPMPHVLFVAFKPGPHRAAMLRLCVAYAGLLLLVLSASAWVDGGTFAQVYLGGQPMTASTAQADAFQAAVWVTLALYAPVAMLFWHAPALVYWGGATAGKALFFSFVACLRNLPAFALYVLAWLACFVVSAVAATLIAVGLGMPELMMAIFMPVVLLITAMFFASMLRSVDDCLLQGQRT